MLRTLNWGEDRGGLKNRKQISKKNNNLVPFMQSLQEPLSCSLRLKWNYPCLDMLHSVERSQEYRESGNTCTIINNCLASTAEPALVQHVLWPSQQALGEIQVNRENKPCDTHEFAFCRADLFPSELCSAPRKLVCCCRNQMRSHQGVWQCSKKDFWMNK